MSKLTEYLRIDTEVEEFDVIHKTIENDLIFRGTNLWILAFAIIVASIGLNMNSTAVVIGAMLISPLMGPINGMGYGVATYNFPLLTKALKNYSFAVLAGLAASTAYFAMSPVSTAHSELLARTSPTIYDVLIAFFGGAAGIVAITSKKKGNVIPGVAIATALMPPLCTAGYGIATAKFNFFFGAIYLFTINTVFIALSAMIVCQYLKLPIRTIESEKSKKINRSITAIILITLIPSIYFGYGLVTKEQFNENAKKFTQNVGIFEGNYLLKDEINPDNKTIILTYGGSTLTTKQKQNIKERVVDFNIPDAKVIIKQGLTFSDATKSTSEIDNLKSKVSKLSVELTKAKKEKDSISNVGFVGKDILEEIRALYPQIKGVSYSNTYLFEEYNDSTDKINLVIFEIEEYSLSKEQKSNINRWVKKRLNADRIKVYYIEEAIK